MAEELDGLDISFERIKIPSAGSTVFEVPGENPGEPDTVKEFSAVILYHHPLHAYYKTKYTGGSQPPDCGSFDGIIGEGDPGGNCPVCPLNQLTLEERIANGGHPVLRWMMDIIFVKTAPAGNIKPDKEKSTERIDGAVALIMALDRTLRHGGENVGSIYDERGLLFI